MTFTLTITMGNDAMRTSSDLADALREVTDKLDILPETDELETDELETLDAYDRSGRIMDGNGNKVGDWDLR